MTRTSFLWLFLGFLFGFLLLTGPSTHAMTTAKVVDVRDGQTLVLDSDKVIRLMGIQAPFLGAGDPTVRPWPMAPESQQFLEQLALNKTVEIDFEKSALDRNGNILAHVGVVSEDDPDADPVWVQSAILKNGMARVVTYVHTRLYASQLLKMEAQARAEKKGIWAHPEYVPIADTRADSKIGQYQIVLGTVKNVGQAGEVYYLNFGSNWKTDFTVVIPQKLAPNLSMPITEFANQAIEVRGWVEEKNGPSITISHPEQLKTIESTDLLDTIHSSDDTGTMGAEEANDTKRGLSNAFQNRPSSSGVEDASTSSSASPASGASPSTSGDRPETRTEEDPLQVLHDSLPGGIPGYGSN